MSTTLNIQCGKDMEGMRIKEILEAFNPAKKTVNHLLNKKVLINGHDVKPDDVCHEKDELTIDFIGILPKAPKPSPIHHIEILYEDDHVVIVEKPTNLLVYDDGQSSDDLTGRVNAYYQHKGYDLPVLPAHRIDMDTSGMILFAKHPLALSYLSQLFEQKNIDKVYICLIQGPIVPSKGSIKTKIMQDRHSQKMMISQQGMDAITHYESLGLEGNHERLKCRIETGRKHQIRVHLMGMGYPVVGDVLYRGERANRLMLHFHDVTLMHPINHQKIHVSSKVPF